MYTQFQIFEIITTLADVDQIGQETERLETEFRRLLSENGFQSIRTVFREGIQRTLQPMFEGFAFDTEKFSGIVGQDVLRGSSGFFVSKEYGAIMLRNTSARLEIVHCCDEGMRPFKDLLYSFPQRMGENHPIIHEESEGQLSERISAKLDAMSPSGKLLSDPENREKAKALFDPKTRTLALQIAAKTNGVLLSTEIPALKKDLGLPEVEFEAAFKLLIDAKIMRKMVRVRCRKCSAPVIHTATDNVDALLSNGFCVFCNEKLDGSRIEEIYVMSRENMQIVSGLWLESFVQDCIETKCAKTWQGRFLGNDELDVVGLTLGNTILFECKTADIGHTDVYNTLIKARRLGADCLFIVATTKINENAKKAIEEFKASESINIRVMEGETDAISKEVKQAIEDVRTKRIEASLLRSIGLPSYRVRRYLVGSDSVHGVYESASA
jgi:hypothetical protein